MKSWVEGISVVGSTLRVAAPAPVPAERDPIAVASAIPAVARLQALDPLVLAGGDPEGFAALRDRGRWPQVLARAVQRREAARPTGAA